MAVVPVAKALYLCEEIDTEGGLTNLYGLFNALRPTSYPHTQRSFRVFAQLGNGMGDVRVHFDISRASDGRLIHASDVQMVRFARRSLVFQVSMEFLGIQFPEPGVYLVGLFCDNTWVADVTMELLEGEDDT
jgi:hypothetical protein